MKRQIISLITAVFLIVSCQKSIKMQYPQAKQVDSTSEYFGTIVKDPFRWMENPSDPDLKKWIEEQNNLTFSYLNKIPYRNAILERLKEIYNFPRQSAPFKKANFYIFFKNNGLQNQSVMYITYDLSKEPEVLLDPNQFSEDGTVALNTYNFSKDGKYLAYAISSAGSDWNEVFVMDVLKKEKLNDHLKWIKFSSLAFYKDGFFYSRFEEPKKGEELVTKNVNQKIYYHKIGTPQSDDKLIYQDPSVPNHGFYASVSNDEKFLVINESAGTSGDAIIFKDLSKPNSKFIKLNNTFENDYSFIDHLNGKLLFYTNYKAPNYRVIAVDPQKPQENYWIDLIPETNEILEGVRVTKDFIVASYIVDVKNILKIFDKNGKFLKEVKMPAIGSISAISANIEDNIIFYGFSSFNIPGYIYKYDIDNDQTTIFYKTPFDKINLDNIKVEQVFYQSKDGTKIPMFLVYKDGLQKNGKNPVWLYGYGGFNISLMPSFDVRRLVWIENGGIYAVANLRGGGEYGEKWHQAGTKFNKQNVFDDFIAAAEFLVKEKYTNPKLIVIQGGSNGGLLVGAVTNQRPDLFRVALPAVGVMDMLRFHLFTIGRAWTSDYGSPVESKEMFEYIYKYSPLHNIDSTKVYPSILVTTADHDDRVVPAHSFKYTATLQSKLQNNPNPLLIRIETKAGHGAGKPLAKVLEEWADLYSFAFHELKIKPIYKK